MGQENSGKVNPASAGLDPSGLNPQDYDYRSNSIEDFSKTMLFSPLDISPLKLTHRMVKSTASLDTWADKGKRISFVHPYPQNEGQFRYLTKGHSHWVSDFELPVLFARKI